MKNKDVKTGEVYLARVTGKVVPVRITGECPHGGWYATNTVTHRKVRIKSAQRLRGKVHRTTTAAPDGKKAAPPSRDTTGGQKRDTGEPRGPKGKLSGLEAAAKVLAEAGEPLNCQAIVERALEKGYWQTAGKTPANTLYAAIAREIKTKGPAGRFVKAARGTFTLTGKEA